MAAKFKASHKGIGELLRSRMIEADMLHRAEKIAAAAEAIAPVYRGAGHVHYKDSFRVTSTSRGGRRRDRAVAYVTNTSPHARFVEYGTERVQAHHVMLRAAQAGAGE